MMAGSNMEEPFHLSFQADSLHSGSISFGRFETESLAWERRSSFSHNRYLEEVEKYSKPGSVTEKKAYFEAHFRKKALLKQSSSEGQNGTEYQSSDNGEPQNREYTEVFDNFNGSIHFTHFEECPDGWEYGGECEATECEYGGENGIEYGGECEVNESEREGMGVLYSNEITNPILPKHVEPEKARQNDVEILPKLNDEPETKEDLHTKTLPVHMTSSAVNSSSSCHTAERDDSISSGQRISSSKGKTASKTKVTRPRLKDQPNVISSEASKRTEKKSTRRETEGLPRSKTEKKSPQTAAPSTSSIRRLPKSEASGNAKAKTKIEKERHGNVVKSKKALGYQSSGSENYICRARPNGNRPSATVSSSKEGLKQSASVFNFKSDQRAERRKEYFTKLEEKMHAKEAEMNQIQTKTQEKTDAEVKQFRKSLNFKATPMPSFYHVVRGSDGRKATSSTLHSKPLSKQRPGTADGSTHLKARKQRPGTADCSTYLKARKQTILSGSEPVNITDPPRTSIIERNHPSEGANGSEVAHKNIREKKDMNPEKHTGTISSNAAKGQMVEGKKIVGARRSSNAVMSKDMKNVDMGRGSKTGHVAVGVAS